MHLDTPWSGTPYTGFPSTAQMCIGARLHTVQSTNWKQSKCCPFPKNCIHDQLGKQNTASAIQYLQSLRCSPESSICVVVVAGGTAATRSYTMHKCRIPSKFAFWASASFNRKGRKLSRRQYSNSSWRSFSITACKNSQQSNATKRNVFLLSVYLPDISFGVPASYERRVLPHKIGPSG
jgi:hypothetical protein